MGVNLRQDVAGILTLTMFVMLGNMIERDHFDSVEKYLLILCLKNSLEIGVFWTMQRIRSRVSFTEPGKGPWQADFEELKPCRSKALLDDVEDTDGVLSIEAFTVDIVVITSYKDMKKDIRLLIVEIQLHLDGVVRVAKKQPVNLSTKNLAVVKVPNRFTEDYIAEHDGIIPAERKINGDCNRDDQC
ncbi:hypothetical protein FEM48_Zijuj05G0179200 [Ziziphus jujuba var. spinosa]|uniref:Uncharacterized protein n=1 Tax=Ziziphus jujuba var. spinosa TaxID=714518 RepID=A0A978VGA1_ZIZJJ|nr:hypothetical protein FEM48_Zijuj05G0179200 [Ziziphus jujuba var. spinosa]